MVQIKVTVPEHGQEFVHTVAQAASLDDVKDVLERLYGYFGATNGRVRIVENGKRLR